MRSRGLAAATAALWVVGPLAVATVAVASLESAVGVPDASAVYLVAVVISGLAAGRIPALASAVAAFVIEDYLFVEPRLALAIGEPGPLRSLLVQLAVAVALGQLAAWERGRREAAVARGQEARTLFGVSRTLATRTSTEDALVHILDALLPETGMSRIWVALGPEPAAERVVADTRNGAAIVPALRLRVLQRTPGDQPARWILVHQPRREERRGPGGERYRVRIEASGEALGSIWAERERGAGGPNRTQTRLLSGTADQLGQALARDRSRAEQPAQQS